MKEKGKLLKILSISIFHKHIEVILLIKVNHTVITILSCNFSNNIEQPAMLSREAPHRLKIILNKLMFYKCNK